MSIERQDKQYKKYREKAILSWNAGVTIKKEINEKYGDRKEKSTQDFIKAFNNVVRILYQEDTSINRCLFVIVNDDEFQSRCDGFPKTPMGLRHYLDDENTKRLILGRGPNRKMLQNLEFKEDQSFEFNVLEKSSNEDIVSDQQLFKNRGLDIRPYNTWSFERDKRFGLEYPGNIAAGIVLNTLYFYTEPGDLVVDPMAGGGVVGDCCFEVDRKCLMYDVKPFRPDIRTHDIRDGIPDEAYNAKLLFWDPPYYIKKAQHYGPESISALDRKQYLEIFEQVAIDSYNAGIEKIALVMSDYISQDGNGKPEDNIFIWDYVNIFKSQHWNPINHIFCQLKTTQLHGRTITKFRREKLFATLSRSLVIFKKV
jgi:hypothetical protein